jgi:preprotein translocase subunit YajC
MLFAATKSSSSPVLLIVLVLAYVAFYVFFIRPRTRRQKAARTSGRQVELGDKVQTIGGLIGTITEMDEHTVTLRAPDGALLQFLRAAIAQKYVEPAAAEPAGEDPAAEGDAG